MSLRVSLLMLLVCGTLAGCGLRSERATKGAICESRSIIGQSIAPVEGPGACGIPNAVRVTEVAGVALSRPATLNCAAARALEEWVEDGAKPAVGRRGGGLQTLEVAASYSCRTRNNRPGARLSEHSKGNAIDISGLTLRNGTEINLLEDWGRFRRNGRILRKMWQSACGPFGVVLGPDSDRYHQDHLHFDISNRRNPYCR